MNFSSTILMVKSNSVFLASANEMGVSPGRRFMIDLLVSSLMADGGLESALNAAITAEIQVSMFYSLVTSSFIHPSCLIYATLNRALPKNRQRKQIDET